MTDEEIKQTDKYKVELENAIYYYRPRTNRETKLIELLIIEKIRVIEELKKRIKEVENDSTNCEKWSYEKITKLEKEIEELKKHRDKLLKKSIIDFQKIDELAKENKELKEEIEKMKTFIHSEIDFCMYCPLTNECKNKEGICPYAYATEEEQKKLLMDFINKWELAE